MRHDVSPALERFGAPRSAAAALTLLSIITILVVATFALTDPAKAWIERAPLSVHRFQERLQGLSKPLEDFRKATDQLESAGGEVAKSEPQSVRVVRPALMDIVLSGTPPVVSSILSATILLFFLLASGHVFLRKLLTVIPTLRDKKLTVEIIRQIQTDISCYLLSFTLVNFGLGAVMAIVTAVLGVPNPVLWGFVVAILNFVPYIGALVSVVILTMVGIQSFDSMTLALASPAILLVLVGLTAEVVTLMVLGRGLLLNPMATFIAILLWGWLWGIFGVLLAVPLLASFKIICELVESLHGVAEFLTT